MLDISYKYPLLLGCCKELMAAQRVWVGFATDGIHWSGVGSPSPIVSAGVFYRSSNKRPQTQPPENNTFYLPALEVRSLVQSRWAKTRVWGGLAACLSGASQEGFLFFLFPASRSHSSSWCFGSLPPSSKPSAVGRLLSRHISLTSSASVFCSEPWRSRWVHLDDPGRSP